MPKMFFDAHHNIVHFLHKYLQFFRSRMCFFAIFKKLYVATFGRNAPKETLESNYLGGRRGLDWKLTVESLYS